MQSSELVPLSMNQEFVAMFDQGSDDGPFGPRYHVVEAWRVTGSIDTGALQAALDDVVARHEALRTLIVSHEGRRFQQILPPCQAELTVRDLPAGGSRDEQAENLIREVEADTIPATKAPLLRCFLARFDDNDAVLVLLTHHLASDGWSMMILIRDLAYLYAARKGASVPQLPAAPQYRDFAMWQIEGAGAGTDKDREFWQRKLDGAGFSAIPTDIARSAGRPELTAAQRFLIPASTVSGITKTAAAARSSAFMAYVAAYNLLVHRLTGATDVVVATFTPGRGDQLFAESVGAFFNFVPIRTDIAGSHSFKDVLDKTRRSCLEAFSHDIPSLLIFAQAPELMMPAMSDNATAAVFQTSPDPVPVEVPGDLKYDRIYRHPSPQPIVSSLPDGALWDLNMDTAGEVHGTASYKTNLFLPDTVAAMAGQYQQILTELATNIDGAAGVTA